MRKSEIPRDLNWVKTRAECTLSRIFKQLHDEIVVDIAMRSDNLSESHKAAKISFELKEEGNESFAVYRNGTGMTTGITFSIAGTNITVMNGRGDIFLQATVGLNNDGRCMLRRGDVDLETWQFRKEALEDLFFWPTV